VGGRCSSNAVSEGDPVAGREGAHRRRHSCAGLRVQYVRQTTLTRRPSNTRPASRRDRSRPVRSRPPGWPAGDAGPEPATPPLRRPRGLTRRRRPGTGGSAPSRRRRPPGGPPEPSCRPSTPRRALAGGPQHRELLEAGDQVLVLGDEAHSSAAVSCRSARRATSGLASRLPCRSGHELLERIGDDPDAATAAGLGPEPHR
jgi:hypothetical protein